MNQVHFKRQRFFPDGLREIVIVLEGDPDKIDASWAVMTLNDLEKRIEIIENESRKLTEQKLMDSLLKDPQTRVEALKLQKLRLEEHIRSISAEIIKSEEMLSEQGEKQ